MQIYRTRENEDVYIAAREFGTSPMKISEDNEISTRSIMPKGRELLIIKPTRTYNVRSGDTLDSISRRFTVTKDELKRMNPELKGRERICQGQLLSIKCEQGGYGAISTNGYFYRGCSTERLIRIIPYVSYLTVCSAVYKEGRLYNTFSPDEAISIAKSYGKIPILRVYMAEFPIKDGIQEFISCITILAKTQGFRGVTLSAISTDGDTESRSRLVLNLRRALMETDTILFAEGDADADCRHIEYADAGILTYDKLHKTDIPTFEEGEAAVMTRYAENAESSRAFIEIPSFAYSMGKYVDKSEAIRITDKRQSELRYDAERMIITAKYGKGGDREIIYESLENTKAKLGLVSELGFLGVSFDIGRVRIADLMMTATMFDICSMKCNL